MSKKRFERVYGDIEVVCIDHDNVGEDRFFDDGDYDKFVKSLNELNDENEQLKMAINSLKLLVQNWEALDEEKDEQLDRQNQALKKLKKENEELKQTIKTICKDYENHHGMDIRNAEWFTAW